MSAAITLGARLFVALQRLLPQRLLSGLVGRIARARAAWIRRPLIAAFLRAYRPDLGEAAQPDPRSYASFNALFTRALRAGARPPSTAPQAVDSPVDGRVGALGPIRDGRLFQAKGHEYSLQALLAGQAELAGRLRNGSFVTIYLAPFNYHRIHMAIGAALAGAWHVPGRLYSVNDATARLVPDLYARNERLVLEFRGDYGTHALVMVGALFVGSMGTVWHGDIERPPSSEARRCGARPLALPGPGAAALARGAELGRFNMGSTVILLLPEGAVRWDAVLADGATLRVGQMIGTLTAPVAAASAASPR